MAYYHILTNCNSYLYVCTGDVDSDLLGEEGHVVGDDHRPEGTAGVSLLLVGQTSTQITIKGFNRLR